MRRRRGALGQCSLLSCLSGLGLCVLHVCSCVKCCGYVVIHVCMCFCVCMCVVRVVCVHVDEERKGKMQKEQVKKNTKFDGQRLSCGEQPSTLRHKLGVITMCGFSVVL